MYNLKYVRMMLDILVLSDSAIIVIGITIMNLQENCQNGVYANIHACNP